LQCLAVIWFGEIQNDLDIVLERGDTGSGDAVSQEVEFSDGEHALLQVEGQPIGGKDGEESPQVFLVLLLGFVV
jgi:hypothetical protein